MKKLFESWRNFINESDIVELVSKRAEHFKFAFLGAVESHGIEMALEMVGIPVKYLGADMLGSLFSIMAEYDRRQALMKLES
jgi:hypothetical protein